MRLFFLVLAVVLFGSAARADMYPDGSNATPPVRFLNKSAAPITAPGVLLSSVNNNASKTAKQIYDMAFGGSTATYDLMQGVGVVPTGSTLLSTNAVAGYILNQNGTVGAGTSRNTVALFGVGVGAATNAATWGGNVLVTDNTAQSISPFHNQKITGFEIDVNTWDTTSDTYGLLLAGASGAQPASAVALEVASLDITGANRAKWTAGLLEGSGCCTYGVIIGATASSGNNLGSMPLDFFVTNGTGGVQTFALSASPGQFYFTHNSGAVVLWSFDDDIYLPASKAILINSDNVMGADNSHNFYVGQGPALATVNIGNSVAPVVVNGGSGTNPIVLNGLKGSAGSGGLIVCIDATGILYKKATCP